MDVPDDAIAVTKIPVIEEGIVAAARAAGDATEVVFDGELEPTAVCTKAVDAALVVLSPGLLVGTVAAVNADEPALIPRVNCS